MKVDLTRHDIEEAVQFWLQEKLFRGKGRVETMDIDEKFMEDQTSQDFHFRFYIIWEENQEEDLGGMLRPIPKITEQKAYDHGYDCGKNGANATNCHFSIFSSPKNTQAWERGKAAAEKEKGGGGE